MAISLALSTLILRESVVTREFLDAGQSFYAAESASEIGLYGVKNNLPGWEPKGGVVPIIIDGTKANIEASKAVAELNISNKCRAYPCFDKDYDVEGKLSKAPDTSAFYATLGLNESATIPLFVMGDDGKPMPITDFTVEFYTDITKADFKDSMKNNNLSDWDVLRWKIVGLKENGGKLITESISDFTAVSLPIGEDKGRASAPSWFGTKSCSDIKEGRYTNDIVCGNYTPPTANSCSVTQAREFYLYKGIGEDRKVSTEYLTTKENPNNHCYPLEWFVMDPAKDPTVGHKLNYLTLTNLINPNVFGPGSSKDISKTKIHYRVELFTDGKATDTIRDYADITADGYSGKSKQSVNVKIKRDSFMPVFNFSLYSTYMDKAIGHGEEYWYGGKDK